MCGFALGVQELWGFTSGAFVPQAAKLYVRYEYILQMPNCMDSLLTYHLAVFGGLGTSRAAGGAKNDVDYANDFA